MRFCLPFGLRVCLSLRLAALFPLAIAGAASGQPLSISGVAGFLSEWQLSGTLNETGAVGEFTTTLDMKHVGLCSQNGPEEKLTEMKLQLTGARSWLARSRSEVRATFDMDGSTCTLSGAFSGTYTGFMDCTGTKGVPITFSVK